MAGGKPPQAPHGGGQASSSPPWRGQASSSRRPALDLAGQIDRHLRLVVNGPRPPSCPPPWTAPTVSARSRRATRTLPHGRPLSVPACYPGASPRGCPALLSSSAPRYAHFDLNARGRLSPTLARLVDSPCGCPPPPGPDHPSAHIKRPLRHCSVAVGTCPQPLRPCPQPLAAVRPLTTLVGTPFGTCASCPAAACPLHGGGKPPRIPHGGGQASSSPPWRGASLLEPPTAGASLFEAEFEPPMAGGKPPRAPHGRGQSSSSPPWRGASLLEPSSGPRPRWAHRSAPAPCGQRPSAPPARHPGPHLPSQSNSPASSTRAEPDS